MPRASNRVNLTISEENILNNKGYEISAKLGEGAYAKVYEIDLEPIVYVTILRAGP